VQGPLSTNDRLRARKKTCNVLEFGGEQETPPRKDEAGQPGVNATVLTTPSHDRASRAASFNCILPANASPNEPAKTICQKERYEIGIKNLSNDQEHKGLPANEATVGGCIRPSWLDPEEVALAQTSRAVSH